jgi:adenylate cyclase
LVIACAFCATEPRPGARFCDACGSPLPIGSPAETRPAAAHAAPECRTVLYADLTDAHDLADGLEPEDWKQVVARLARVCTDAVERFGGIVDEAGADSAVVATFTGPDHARQACHAALLLSAAACGLDPAINARYGIELSVRVGLNSGEVPPGPVGHGSPGHPLDLAQRLEALAQPGSVYVSEHTARLVSGAFGLRDLGKFTVRGSTVPLGVYELTAATGTVVRQVGSTTLVGRESERASLTVALDAALEGQASVVGLVGEAGAGKTRLCADLTAEAHRLGVVVRSTAGVWNASTVPLLPIRALFRDYFALADDDSAADARDRIAARLLDLDARLGEDLPVIFDFLEISEPDNPAPALGPDARRARLLEVLRRLTRARSERDPLLLILEDLHWFDEQSRAFLEAWLPSFVGSRTLIVTTFTPAFSAAWMNRSFFRKVLLQPLGREAIASMLHELVGSDPSLAPLTEGLADRAGGNPFFVSEIVRGWVEDGTLTGGPGAYRLARSVSQVVVPPSVHAVLVGRVDRLMVRQKNVLQAAATIGNVFSTAVLDRVADLDPDELAEVLGQLCSADLIVPTDSGDYRFANPLTQEVAYASLLASARRAQHRAVADALVATAPARLDELAVLIAHQYEAAEEPLRAAHLRLRAARVAMAGDPVEAEGHTRAALAHLANSPADAETERLGVEARTMLLRLGARTGMDRGEVTALFDAASPAAERLGDPRLRALLAIARGSFSLWADGEPPTAHHHWVEARTHLDPDDVELQAWLSTLIGWGACYHGRLAAALDEVDRALGLCRDDARVGIALLGHSLLDPARLVRARILGLTGELGMAAAEIARSLSGFEQRPMPEAHAWALSVRTEIAALAGDFAAADAARTGARTALALAVESGNATSVVRARLAVGLGELLAGRPDIAVTSLEQGITHAREQRSAAPEEPNLLATLARAEMMRGDVAAAGRLAQEAIEVAERQGSDVAACLAHVTWAQILTRTAVAETDRGLAADVIAAGFEYAERSGALTYAAFLSEEEARLSGSVRSLAAAAGDYESIGAFGHAARVRAELDTVTRAVSGF